MEMNRTDTPDLADRPPAPRQDLPDLTQVSIWAVCGAILLVLAWLFPAHWKAVSPTVMERAGRGTPTLGQMGLDLVKVERSGPATLVLNSAQATQDPQAPALAANLAALSSRQPGLARWGSHERNLETLLGASLTGLKPGTPALEVFITEPVRAKLVDHFKNSRLPGVQSILRTRDLTNTTAFVPATRPGGQPFEATILLTALLYEGENFSNALAQEIKSVADAANESKNTTAWENVCVDLLALGKRMNWAQMTELLRFVTNAKTLAGFAQIARAFPEKFPLAYSSALLTQQPENVARYLLKHEKHGAEYLSVALARGQGAATLLVKRQLPLAPKGAGSLAFAAPLVLAVPTLAAALKMLGFIGAILCFYAVWARLSAVESVEGVADVSSSRRLRRGGVAVVLAVLLIAASEPFLFVRAGTDALQPQLKLPVLSNSPAPPSQADKNRSKVMNIDLSTILSVAFFGALQIVVYSICLMKIQEIDRQSGPARLKLKLMENEENLFDSGLYVGIAGTAAALILQVLQLIEANLLAAYSSNLFGILCVALVKIRHVRAFKRKLILRSQVEAATATESTAAPARALA
jgi:hypothetical protein